VSAREEVQVAPGHIRLGLRLRWGAFAFLRGPVALTRDGFGQIIKGLLPPAAGLDQVAGAKQIPREVLNARRILIEREIRQCGRGQGFQADAGENPPRIEQKGVIGDAPSGIVASAFPSS
jgi:hypothetical protein